MSNRKVKSNYVDSVRRIAGRYEEKAGWIGISPTQIETGIPDLIWVRFSNNQAVKALNKLAPLVYNYPVKIARSDSSSFWEVTAIRQPYGSTILESLKYHHTQHEYPAGDTIWVRDAQFTPLLVLPTTGFIINVYGGVVIQNGSYYIVANQTMDLSSSVPINGAVWVLIEVVAGVLTATLSAEYNNRTLLTVDVLPSGTGVRLCAIQLYTGQESIQRNTTVNHFLDLRWTQGGNGDGVYLDELLDVNVPTPSDGQVLTWDIVTSKWISRDTQYNAPVTEQIDVEFGSFRIDGILYDVINATTSILATRAVVLSYVYIHCNSNGSAGSTIVDINLNGTTIFTTQANCPELGNADVYAVSGIPDVIDLVVGDVLTLDIDQHATGAGDLSVILTEAVNEFVFDNNELVMEVE